MTHTIDMTVYGITDAHYLTEENMKARIWAAIAGGMTVLQWRDKTHQWSLQTALEVRQLCKEANIPFIVNDDVELAITLDADGVHLGQDDLYQYSHVPSSMILGVSAHSLEEAEDALAKGADYLGVGAVFETASKKDATPLDWDILREICKKMPIPVCAIGGITADNIDDLLHTGIQGVAVISALFGTDSPYLAAKALTRSFYRPTALTIAGSDCSGGAGIQADLKTMLANGVYGMSVITALTAQNTQAVQGSLCTDPTMVTAQLQSVFTDIVPQAIKIGMLGDANVIHAVATELAKHQEIPVVLDPVMVSTSGCALLDPAATSALTKELFPLATVITPNIQEGEVLWQQKIRTRADREAAATQLGDTYGCAVLLKGGHSDDDADDVLYDGKTCHWFPGERIANENTHGTGCTLSSAIASHIAKGNDLYQAVSLARSYVRQALTAQLDIGKGRGPLDHGYRIR